MDTPNIQYNPESFSGALMICRIAIENAGKVFDSSMSAECEGYLLHNDGVILETFNEYGEDVNVVVPSPGSADELGILEFGRINLRG